MNSYSNQRHDERRPDPAQNDEIDLRDFTRNLLRYKWLFLIVPVICAAAAIFYANVYAPKVYQATAQIVLSRAGLQSNFDPKLQTTVQLPDASTFKDLAMVDEMLQQVAQTPQVAELFGGNATASSIKG